LGKYSVTRLEKQAREPDPSFQLESLSDLQNAGFDRGDFLNNLFMIAG